MSLHPKIKPTNATQATPVSVRRSWLRWWPTRWWKRIMLLFLMVLIITPLVIYITAPKYYTILLIGSDQRAQEHARSDVLLLVSIPKNASAAMSLIMIPRDTKIDDPKYGLQKITHFYAMWDDTVDRLGNRALTQQQVEQLLGIHINATVEITFDSFVEIIDGLGGVDTSQGHLDGSAAVELVHNRYNKPDGDFGRGAVEREVVKSIMERVHDLTAARWLYSYFGSAERARLTYGRSSLIQFAMAYLIGHHGRVDLASPQEQVLPGVGKKIYTPDFGKELYYWVLDDDRTKALVSTYLH